VKKLNPFRVAMKVIRVIRVGIKELQEATAEDSDGGKKITDEEAWEAAAVIGSAVVDVLFAEFKRAR
jgi:hypothetical protein